MCLVNGTLEFWSEADLENGQVPILMSIKLRLDHSPTHRFLYDLMIIWDVDFRDGVLEVIVPVHTIAPPPPNDTKTKGGKSKMLARNTTK